MAKKCVHKGCGKTYENEEEECVYHPGPPVFHEGQKGKIYKSKAVNSEPKLTRILRLEMLQTARSDLRRVPCDRALHERETLRRRRHTRT
jgi:hypothetical protein